MKKRIQSFKPMQWVGMVAMIVVGILCLLMAIQWTIDLAQGIPFFTRPGTSNDPIGEPIVTYEWVVLVVFYVLALGLFGMAIYEFFFMPLKPDAPVVHRIDFVDGKAVSYDETQVKSEKKDKKPNQK